jgi:hypothetical protein
MTDKVTKLNENNLNELNDNVEEYIINDDSLIETIFDLSIDINTRILALERYYEINEDHSIEIISRITGMYQFSGTKSLEKFLIRICTSCNISSFLKLEAAKSLLSFYEDVEVIYDNDKPEMKIIKKESNEHIIERNNIRKTQAYKCLDSICFSLKNLSTPCKIDAVCILMESETYKKQSLLYFIDIINDNNIDCDYRYKAILSLEYKKDSKGPEKYKIDDRAYFIKNSCLEFLYNNNNRTMYRILSAQYLLQKSQNINNIDNNSLVIDSITSRKIQLILLGFAQDELLDYNIRADAADTLLNLGEEHIKREARNIIMVLGRLIGGNRTVFDNAQNVHVQEVEKSVSEILHFLTSFPIMQINNIQIDLEYIICQIQDIIKKEKEIFIDIKIQNKIKNLLSTPNSVTGDIGDGVVTGMSGYIGEGVVTGMSGDISEGVVTGMSGDISEGVVTGMSGEIDEIKEIGESGVIGESDESGATGMTGIFVKTCCYCYEMIEEDENIKDREIDGKFYCCNECFKNEDRIQKILISLNRINIDRILYSKYNQTLANILIKVWSYIDQSEHKSEMISRLLEELYETAGTCSSGFATRLCNSITGFGEFSIKISFEDQIVSNLIGRMDAKARNITNIKNSIYYKEKHRDVVELYMREKGIILKKKNKKELLSKYTLDNLIDQYLETDRDEKIKLAVENFSDNVLVEMADSSNYHDRPNFIKFFRDNLLSIRDELYLEFKEYMSDTEFDLCTRKAVSVYEGMDFLL